jgi:hypothetical protein
MVHIIVFEEGNPAMTGQATAYLQQLASGWIEVRPRVWFVGSHLNAREWADTLGQFGVRVCVARLKAEWGTQGMGEVASWLKGAHGAF